MRLLHELVEKDRVHRLPVFATTTGIYLAVYRKSEATSNRLIGNNQYAPDSRVRDRGQLLPFLGQLTDQVAPHSFSTASRMPYYVSSSGGTLILRGTFKDKNRWRG